MTFDTTNIYVQCDWAMGGAIAKGVLKTPGIAYVAAQNAAGTANANGVVVTLPVLEKGNGGPQVKALQAMLKGPGYNLGVWGIDGDFGAQTAGAVEKFQKSKGLVVDGIVGKATWSALLGI